MNLPKGDSLYTLNEDRKEFAFHFGSPHVFGIPKKPV